MGLRLEGFESQKFTVCGVGQLGHQGEPHFEVVTNFSHGANRGTRIADGVFLFNRNGWAYVFNRVHFRSLASFQKLPDVRAEGFDVFSLPLGVKDVEEEGRLARPAPSEQEMDPAFAQEIVAMRNDPIQMGPLRDLRQLSQLEIIAPPGLISEIRPYLSTQSATFEVEVTAQVGEGPTRKYRSLLRRVSERDIRILYFHSE